MRYKSCKLMIILEDHNDLESYSSIDIVDLVNNDENIFESGKDEAKAIIAFHVISTFKQAELYMKKAHEEKETKSCQS